ncbi:MAG: hydrogenase maturation protease [Methylocystis sp.]
MSRKRARWLVFGVGNPSRGDDAIAPVLIERLEEWWASARELSVELTLLTDFQWQVEHALDLRGVDLVIFVDASLTASAPFRLEPLVARFDVTYTTHALSPACVLAVAERLGQTLPEAWQMSIPGRNFELGAPLSAPSRSHVEAAIEFVQASLTTGRLDPGEYAHRA